MRILKQIFALIITVMVLLGTALPASCAEEQKTLRIIFTSDIHSHLNAEEKYKGLSGLKYIIDQYLNDNTVILDCGDYSVGTLLGATCCDSAFELIGLGLCGTMVTTIGNHEFDYGPDGLASMLNAATASGGTLPKIVQSNIIFPDELTKEQLSLKEAFDNYGVSESVILDINGVKVGIMGLLGKEAVSNSPTATLDFVNYKTAAKKLSNELSKEADIVIALSHSGILQSLEGGDDIDLLKAVPNIDVVISGHSHLAVDTPITVGSGNIFCCGNDLMYVGVIDLVLENDIWNVKSYKLIPCDTVSKAQSDINAYVDSCRESIADNYLKEDISFDTALCYSSRDFMTIEEMYANDTEYPLGNMIADSYLYAAKKNGIDDVQIAIVALGTIRNSIKKGTVSVEQAYEICSLGEGIDGTSGHPLVAGYLTGKEVKLLCELDASMGGLLDYIRMSYGGLKVEINDKRAFFDRITKCVLVDDDGNETEIKNDEMYKVVCNAYAANMLGLVNNITKGILKITPKNKDGSIVQSVYDNVLYFEDGKEMKEWAAFADYLQSFNKGYLGYPEIPIRYYTQQGRKTHYQSNAINALSNPGLSTVIELSLILVLIAGITLVSIKISRKALNKNSHTEEHNNE